MNTILSRTLATGFFFLLIFLTGFWLSRSGKPYSTVLFNLHKIIALGTVVFLSVMVFKLHQTVPLQTLQIAAITVAVLCAVATVLTGGLLSIEKSMPEFILRVHQITPYLTVISSAVTLYLLFVGSGQLAPA